jgi:hypothetical protein
MPSNKSSAVIIDCKLINGSLSRVENKKDFILQNHFVKKRNLFFFVRSGIREKYLKGAGITLLSKDFQIRCYDM